MNKLLWPEYSQNIAPKCTLLKKKTHYQFPVWHCRGWVQWVVKLLPPPTPLSGLMPERKYLQVLFTRTVWRQQPEPLLYLATCLMMTAAHSPVPRGLALPVGLLYLFSRRERSAVVPDWLHWWLSSSNQAQWKYEVCLSSVSVSHTFKCELSRLHLELEFRNEREDRIITAEVQVRGGSGISAWPDSGWLYSPASSSELKLTQFLWGIVSLHIARTDLEFDLKLNSLFNDEGLHWSSSYSFLTNYI